MLNATDLHRTLDSAIGTFIALMLVEGLVKPIARQLTRYLVKKLDSRIKILPDWLYDPNRHG